MSRMRLLTRWQRPEFAQACRHTRAGLRDAIDLVLIHNEGQVRGDQPRTTLSRATALFAVAAWERFVVDVEHLARGGQAPGTERSHAVYLGAGHGGSVRAGDVLGDASAGEVPEAWRIRVPSYGRGRSLRFGPPVEGLHPDLVEIIDWWVLWRHTAVHRQLPDALAWMVSSDAAGQNGHTINTTLPRFAVTLFLQVIDQSIRGLVRAADFDHDDELLLPEDWLAGCLAPGSRGITDTDQLRLWGGDSLTV